MLPNDVSAKSISLVSLKNTSETSGSFVLGTGMIEGTEYYYYFYKTCGEGYARGKIKVYKAILYENNSIEPQLKWIEEIPNRKWMTLLFSFGGILINHFEEVLIDQHNFELIVPKGTIIQQFQVY